MSAEHAHEQATADSPFEAVPSLHDPDTYGDLLSEMTAVCSEALDEYEANADHMVTTRQRYDLVTQKLTGQLTSRPLEVSLFVIKNAHSSADETIPPVGGSSPEEQLEKRAVALLRADLIERLENRGYDIEAGR